MEEGVYWHRYLSSDEWQLIHIDSHGNIKWLLTDHAIENVSFPKYKATGKFIPVFPPKER